MVDTHTSNGADYSYTMTLIHTQADKLGGSLGPFLRDTMLPALFADMDARGWPTCPYVNPGQGQSRPRHRRIPRDAALLDRLRGPAPHDRLHARDAHAQALRGPLRLHARAGRSGARLHRHARRTNPGPAPRRPRRPAHAPAQCRCTGRWTKRIRPASVSRATRPRYSPSILGDYTAPVVRPQRAVGAGDRLLQPLPGRRHRVSAARLHRAAAVARSDRAPAVERRADDAARQPMQCRRSTPTTSCR